MREVRWERMFPDELEAAFAACPLVYFSYGLCEPHGPQNAVGLDALKAHAIAVAAAQAGGGVVAPADYWHIHEIGGYASWLAGTVGNVPRSWMTCVPPWQHFKHICYQVRQAEALGMQAALFLTGHYGPNWQDLKTLLGLLQPHVGTRLYGLPDFEANTEGFDGGGKSTGDHAGKVETSLLMALEPSCVDMTRLPPSDHDGPHFAMGSNASESDRRIGERMVADEVRFLVAKGQSMLADYDRLKPPHSLLTFAAVERVWDEVVRPKFGAFRTMQLGWSKSQPLPSDSVWALNQPIPPQIP
jgi:creatinine amidohydrolase